MEEEDEAGCCARHGTLASGLESWAPRARRCIASFTSQPLFYPFFFHLSSPYFFLSLSLFLSLSFFSLECTPLLETTPKRLQCCEVTAQSISVLPTPLFDVTTYSTSVFFCHIQRFREGLRSKVDTIEGGGLLLESVRR